MMNEKYPTETLDSDDDNGTMPDNVAMLTDAVVGHRIVSARQEPKLGLFTLQLDNGTAVDLIDTEQCCASTELKAFLLHPERVEHVVTGVGTTDGYTHWHIYADMGDILELTVGWDPGNPFYYAYGFDIKVRPTPGAGDE